MTANSARHALVIRPMTPDDIPACARLVERGAFNRSGYVQLIGVRPGERCGIGNVTFLSPLSSAQGAIAFNTGPGNMLIDYCVSRASAGALTFDRDGALAARGALSKPRATCRLPTRRRCWCVVTAK